MCCLLRQSFFIRYHKPRLDQLCCLADEFVQTASLRLKFFMAGAIYCLFTGTISFGMCQQYCKVKDLECKQLAVGSCRNSTGNQTYAVKQSASNSCDGETWKTGKGSLRLLPGFWCPSSWRNQAQYLLIGLCCNALLTASDRGLDVIDWIASILCLHLLMLTCIPNGFVLPLLEDICRGDVMELQIVHLRKQLSYISSRRALICSGLLTGRHYGLVRVSEAVPLVPEVPVIGDNSMWSTSAVAAW